MCDVEVAMPQKVLDDVAWGTVGGVQVRDATW